MKGLRVNFCRKECKVNFVIIVKIILSFSIWFIPVQEKEKALNLRINDISEKFRLTNTFLYGIIYLTKRHDIKIKKEMPNE